MLPAIAVCSMCEGNMCAGLWVARKVLPFLEKKEWGLRSDECARIRFTSLPMSGPINMLKTGS